MQPFAQLKKGTVKEYIRKDYSGPLTSEQVFDLLHIRMEGNDIQVQFDSAFPMGEEHRKAIIEILEEVSDCHGFDAVVVHPDCGY